MFVVCLTCLVLMLLLLKRHFFCDSFFCCQFASFLFILFLFLRDCLLSGQCGISGWAKLLFKGIKPRLERTKLKLELNPQGSRKLAGDGGGGALKQTMLLLKCYDRKKVKSLVDLTMWFSLGVANQQQQKKL